MNHSSILNPPRPRSTVLRKNGGEDRILDAYLDALAEARDVQHGEGATPYPRDVAARDYKLAVIDYGRFVVSRFWTNASPEEFAKKV